MNKYEELINNYAEFMKVNPEYSYTLTKDLPNLLAKKGNLQLLKEFHKMGLTFDEYTMINAAKNSNTNTLEWLIEIGCPKDTYAFTEAAYKGNLRAMEIMLKNDFPWDSYTFLAAIRNGNINNVKWLYASGCPYDKRCLATHEHRKFNKKDSEWLIKTLSGKKNDETNVIFTIGDQTLETVLDDTETKKKYPSWFGW